MEHHDPPCHIGRLDAQSLAHILKHVDFHTRREVVPLVCKQWRAASGPQSPIWESCELSHPSRVFVPDLALPMLRWSAVVQWFAARIGQVKDLTFGGVTPGHVLKRHDLHPSAAAALIALLHASLERVAVIDGAGQATKTCDASMYSMLRTAPGLTRLEMKGIDLPSGQTKGNQFLALRGAPLRHLVLHVPRFYNSGTGSEEALMSVLADLPQLVSLDMSFPRDNWSSRTSRDWLAPTGLASLTSLRLNLVKPSNGLSALTNLQALTLMNCAISAANPINLSTLTALTSLDLTMNRGQDVVASLAGLTRLRSLNLSNDSVTAEQLEAAAPLAAQHLTKLGLAKNALKILPAFAAAMTSLADLDLSDNSLTALPPGPYLGALTRLNLEACLIKKLPTQLAGATALEDLRLGGTALANNGMSAVTLRLLGKLPRLRQVHWVRKQPRETNSPPNSLIFDHQEPSESNESDSDEEPYDEQYAEQMDYSDEDDSEDDEEDW